MTYTHAYFAPPDVVDANKAWGATCGPCALAAIFGVPVNTVRPFFPLVTPDRTWCNPTEMRVALRSAGRRFEVVQGSAGPTTPAAMVLVQFEGPWTEPGANPLWAYRHTHWVAARFGEQGRRWVYDVNADGWTTVENWSAATLAELLADVPRATGWRTKLSLVLERP